MRSPEELAWFKLLACKYDTWPSQNCQHCWNRMMNKLESVFQMEHQKEIEVQKKLVQIDAQHQH